METALKQNPTENSNQKNLKNRIFLKKQKNTS